MRKIGFLLFFSIFLLGVTAQAQIVNGSFADGLNGWTSLGSPQADTTQNPPSVGAADAFISSTDAGGSGKPDSPTSDTAADIESALGITSLPAADFVYAPVDGQAIYQKFTLTSTANLTFSFSYATNDEAPYDSVGYVLNGSYTQIMATGLPQPTPDAYMQYPGTITLGPGTYTLGFVAFNTADNNGATSIYVTDVSLADAPEPSTWMLAACGLGALALIRRTVRSEA